ncbi:hypothetical protein D3C75_863230 [compost metagenome]
MSEYFENIRIAEYLAVVVQPNPWLLRAVTVPVGEAVVDKLNCRIIGERCQKQQRNQQKGYDNNGLLFVIR